jgi:hypothetical protein
MLNDQDKATIQHYLLDKKSEYEELQRERVLPGRAKEIERIDQALAALDEPQPASNADAGQLWPDEKIITTYRAVFGDYPGVGIMGFIRMIRDECEAERTQPPAPQAMTPENKE